MARQKNSSSQLERLLDLPGWRIKQSGRWLTKGLSQAIKHLPDREESTFTVFKSSVLLLFMIKQSPKFKSKILSMLGSLQKSKWTTFLDKLTTSSDQSTLPIELLRTLLQELTSKEKAYQLFWKPACKEISERLLLPTGTDYAGSGSNSLNKWLQKQEVRSPSLTIKTTRHVNRNLQMTSWPSSMSSLADKWANEAMPTAKAKTLKVKIYPTQEQKIQIDRFMDVSRYVYNRTLEHINNGHRANFQELRDLLVTQNTKKHLDEYKAFDSRIRKLKDQKQNATGAEVDNITKEIKTIQQQRRDVMKGFDYAVNQMVQKFETEVPKDIRACAVKRCCDAFKAGLSNLRNGNIRHFKMQFKKKKERYQSIELTPKIFSIKDCAFRICPDLFRDCILRVHKNTQKRLKDLEIVNNVDIVRSTEGYFVHICVPVQQQVVEQHLDVVAGVDPGVRTFATVHSHSMSTNETIVYEYKHRIDLLNKLNAKIKLLKAQKRIRKKQLSKLDRKKKDLVDALHWDFINDLLARNDVVYFGDIKSHDIVQGSNNKKLNTSFNDLKFYQLKQRLLYKAGTRGKQVIFVPEHYTTKTCSCCGEINNHVGSKDVFECQHCHLLTGRDLNASKNIKLKGFFL